jgi:hypothetical protein
MKKANTKSTRKRPAKIPASKAICKMTTAELRAATAEFDQEQISDTFRPATPEEKARFERARKRGRPRIGAGSKTIRVTVEAGLLAETDRLAKKLRVPRAVLIARGLRSLVERR